MMGQPTQLSGLRFINLPSRSLGGLICHGKLLASLFNFISQDIAPRASLRVYLFLDSPMSVVHQQLP
jgi:hypothetical protein